MNTKDFEEYLVEYHKRYPSGGPSMSSFCLNINDEKICGCWVHELMRWRQQNTKESETQHTTEQVQKAE